MLIVDWFYDGAVSGADPVEARAAFSALLARIAGNGVRTIIVRLGRRARQWPKLNMVARRRERPQRLAPRHRARQSQRWSDTPGARPGNAARRDWLIQDTTEMFKKLHERLPTRPRIQRSRAKDGAPASHPYAAGASRCYGTQCPLRCLVFGLGAAVLAFLHRLSRLRLGLSRFPTYGASQVRFRNGLVISEGVPRAKRSAPISRRKSRCWN